VGSINEGARWAMRSRTLFWSPPSTHPDNDLVVLALCCDRPDAKGGGRAGAERDAAAGRRWHSNKFMDPGMDGRFCFFFAVTYAESCTLQRLQDREPVGLLRADQQGEGRGSSRVA